MLMFACSCGEREEKPEAPDPIAAARSAWEARDSSASSPVINTEMWARIAMADASLDGTLHSFVGVWGANAAYFDAKEKTHLLFQVVDFNRVGTGKIDVLMPDISTNGVSNFINAQDHTGRIVTVEGVVKMIDGDLVLVTFETAPQV